MFQHHKKREMSSLKIPKAHRRSTSSVAVKFACQNQHKEEVLSDFDVKELIIFDDNITFTFEVEPRDIIVLPECNIISATQKKKNLKTGFRKGVCEVYKKFKIYEGTLVSQDNTLNSKVNFVLIKTPNGSNIRINNPEKVICKPDVVTITPLFLLKSIPIKVTVSIKNAFFTEFIHTLSETESEEEKEDIFSIEQCVTINNNTQFNFNKCETTKIVIPVTNKEVDGETKNTVLEIVDIGDIFKQSKEMCYYSNVKIEKPEKYVMISSVSHEISKRIREFNINHEVYPGMVSCLDLNGEISNISYIQYSKDGDNFLIDDGEAHHIIISELEFTDTGFKLKVLNDSDKNEFVKIEEIKEIKNVKINGEECKSDIMTINPGISTLEGEYLLD